MPDKILVVEDNLIIQELIVYRLQQAGYEVIALDQGGEVEEIVAKDRSINLIVLDITLPGKSGLEICTSLKRQNNNTPIILLTAKDTEIDKIVGFALGADDYVTKPFSPRELMARVKAILRRTTKGQENVDEICFGEVSVNIVKHIVKVNGEEVKLKPKEFELMKILVLNPGVVLTRDALLQKIWGDDYFDVETRTIDVHMRRLRKKIEQNSRKPVYLKTVHGIGYKFKPVDTK